MVAQVETVAFIGLSAKAVKVQVQLSSGLPAFTIVGLPDKAVAESRERVNAALRSLNLSPPTQRVTVNLSPADIPKEGSHYDLPIALGLLVAMGALPEDCLDGFVVLGELGLDAGIEAVAGALLAALFAVENDKALICPAACGAEAAWAGDLQVLAPDHLLAMVNHFKGTQILTPATPGEVILTTNHDDLNDIKGQESAKRALEVAAAGGHNMLMVGPPGSGKSMLASRMPSILPPLSPSEALELSMITSIAGLMHEGKMNRCRPFRNPHHSASMPALIGGGNKAKPGEVSLAHNGVLFLDELPEFSRQTLEALRQPIESGQAVVARAANHVTYPARFQLIAAMNPCRCGYLSDPAQACNRAPKCAIDYQAKISGPMFDRIDIHIDVPAVSASDLTLPPPREGSAEIAARVSRARAIQAERYADFKGDKIIRTNAEVEGQTLEKIATPDIEGQKLLSQAIDKMKLTARGYHRVLRVARTLADLEGAQQIARHHIAESLAYRRVSPHTP